MRQVIVTLNETNISAWDAQIKTKDIPHRLRDYLFNNPRNVDGISISKFFTVRELDIIQSERNDVAFVAMEHYEFVPLDEARSAWGEMLDAELDQSDRYMNAEERRRG